MDITKREKRSHLTTLADAFSREDAAYCIAREYNRRIAHRAMTAEDIRIIAALTQGLV